MAHYAALLLSRQALRPCAAAPWVRQSMAALDWLRAEGLTVISSVGMPTWELICAAAGLRGVPQVVIVPGPGGARGTAPDSLCAAFGLGETASFHPLPVDSRKAFPSARDQVVFSLADLLVPISIRPGGFMATRLAEYRSAGRAVVARFAVAYRPREEPLRYAISERELNPDLEKLSRHYVTHWTRAARGPWPDELPIDYYRSILASPAYPRTALDTLRRILTSRRLVASDRHLPRGVRAVAFSGLSPHRVLPLIRWRARYREMSFEPYGVAIDASVAREHGILPVEYCDPATRPALPPDDHWRLQSSGVVGDWVREEEYRCEGDFDLGTVPEEALLAFCRFPAEAGDIARTSGVRCLPLLARDPRPPG